MATAQGTTPPSPNGDPGESEVDFQKRFDLAISKEDALVQARGEAEKRFPDYLAAQHHLKFKKMASKALKNPAGVRELHGPLKNAQFIMKNFDIDEAGGEDETDGPAEPKRLPTLTFGDLMVPVRFTNKNDPLDTESFNRKYILLSDDSPPDKIWQLMSKVWRLPKPKVALSFTSGSAEALMNNTELRDIFCSNLYKFCKSTGVWILSDGLHSGISRLIGRVFQSDLEPDNLEDADFQRDVTLLGVCSWEKLKDKTLLHGISLERDYGSYYFYPNELELEGQDIGDMLNPFQHAYVLISPKADGAKQDLRSKLEVFLKNGYPSKKKVSSNGKLKSNSSGTPKQSQPTNQENEDAPGAENIPMVNQNQEDEDDGADMMNMFLKPNVKVVPVLTFVVGGDHQTLGQLKTSVMSKIPAVILPQSGDIPKLLEGLYKKLESIFPRSCNQKPDLTQNELTALDEMLEDQSYRGLFNNQNDDADTKHNISTIMRYRYYLTILDLSTERSADFKNVIRTIYKPYRRNECMNIALNTNSISFLRAIFSREVDPEFEKESGYVDAKGLLTLHKSNLKDNKKLFDVENFIAKHEEDEDKFLPLVGRILFDLAGYKYRLFYQQGLSHVDDRLGNPREQFWHLFLYAVLANKPHFAEYFMSLTRCPLGAALFAYKLFLGMSRYAHRNVESEKAESLQKSADHFEDLAVKLLDEMYRKSPKNAYISLTREVPFDLGPYITPLSLAADAEAMKFMKTACCQTTLQRLWVKNMQLSEEMKTMIPLLAIVPMIGIAMIIFKMQFQETKTPSQYIEEQDMIEEENGEGDEEVKTRGVCCGPTGKCCWKVKSFYTAPVVKFWLSVASYMLFLSILSYFFLTQLDPVSSVGDIHFVEWLCYTWPLGFLVEECFQVYSGEDRGPLHMGNGKDLKVQVWPFYTRWALKMRMHKLILYLKDGSWNTIDIIMLSFFVATTVCRFVLHDNNFQLVRVLYCVSIIIFFFRTLRFFYVLKVIGPRIIAIQMMFKELVMFLVILGVFLLSFGVAFQGLLHPKQEPSWTVVGDIIWRTYWQMFGELFIGDGEESKGMGRDVGNSSCMAAQEAGSTDLNCYSWVPAILLGVYLFISNILLLNLLVAIFGNTLNAVEGRSTTHWAFHQYGMVHEYYDKLWIPAPLNILWYIVKVLYTVIYGLFQFLKSPLVCLKECKVKCCAKKKKKAKETFPNDHFRTNSILRDKYLKQIDPAQREAYNTLQRLKKIQA